MGPTKWKTTVAIIPALCLCLSVCGSPIPESATEKVIFSNLLQNLLVNCSDNPLLNDTYVLGECEKSDGKLNKIGLYCYSYLDVNRRLCALKSDASFNITERLRLEQSKVLTSDMVCGNASGITFGSLPEQPHYKSKIDSIFSNKNKCSWFCNSVDEESEAVDVKLNSFCKVVYYISAIIKNVRGEIDHANAPPTLVQSMGVLPSAVNNRQMDKNMNTAQLGTEPQQHDTQPDPVTNVQHKIEQKPLDTENKVAAELAQVTSSKTPVKVEGNASNKAKIDTPSYFPVSENALKSNDERNMGINESKLPTDVGTSLVNIQNANLPVRIDDKLTTTSTSTVKSLNVLENIPPALGDKPENGEQDDYDNLPQGEDSPLADIGNNDIDSDDEDIPKKVETSHAKQVSIGREFETAIVPDEYMDEEEGHFIPLFFFAVGTMVLLYILYHNKNKVMGLLIEGRQTGGRRRNSRGHAYRRLDTLEQAISSTAPQAAPSKIIY